MVALSATSVFSDPSLRSLNPTDRNCMFREESYDLKIYKVAIFESEPLEQKFKLYRYSPGNHHKIYETGVLWQFPGEYGYNLKLFWSRVLNHKT